MKLPVARLILIITWPVVQVERFTIRFPVLATIVLTVTVILCDILLSWWLPVYTFLGGMAYMLIMVNARRARERAAILQRQKDRNGTGPALVVLMVPTEDGFQVDSQIDLTRATRGELAGALMGLAREIEAGDRRAKAEHN